MVDALCRWGLSDEARHWLLRHSCDGDPLSGYFAGQIATAAHLHQAITADEVDDELVDHTGAVLRIMSGCEGMGTTLEHYPPASIVLTAHATRFARLEPTALRYINGAILANRLTVDAGKCGCGAAHAEDLVRQYLDVLTRPAWRAAAAAMNPEHAQWFDHNTTAVRALLDY
ncbi:hypothetical protein [Kutzneria sp. 744]|uniref:hypothetical protein n=1 Tax=Kutzneria sp. (strain 744) TaxID=345341 RepID=UPI0003EEADF1|nr:hypothetical protein [Kutzneria sp. 744]EWM19303.1 hypothetical protein KUTG_09607 [Kutzneria sp. 744]